VCCVKSECCVVGSDCVRESGQQKLYGHTKDQFAGEASSTTTTNPSSSSSSSYAAGIAPVQVVNITTPGNFFHVLRRQIHRDFRKPLVVMTPKSLLRHPLARSSYEEMASGTRFRSVIHDDESSLVAPQNVKKLLVCSGKVYFDLLERKLRDRKNDVAITRVEQVLRGPRRTLHVTRHTPHVTRHTSHVTRHTRCRFAPSPSKVSARRSIATPTPKFPGFRSDFAFARWCLQCFTSYYAVCTLRFFFCFLVLPNLPGHVTSLRPTAGGAKEPRRVVLH
jgi:hypothetical protein